jgi:hypothetical protein
MDQVPEGGLPRNTNTHRNNRENRPQELDKTIENYLCKDEKCRDTLKELRLSGKAETGDTDSIEEIVRQR